MGPWMIPAAMSIFGGLFGAQAGNEMVKLGKEQEKLAEKNKLLGKRELAEQVRRQQAEDARLQSAALARGAASGATVSGSVAEHLTHMEDEHGRQLDWLETSGASRIRLDFEADMLRAKSTIMQGKTQGTSSFMDGLIGAFGYANRSGMFT